MPVNRNPRVCDEERNMTAADPIRNLLGTSTTVAVVGCSNDSSRPSHRVAAYLQRQGFRVIPVNPGHSELLGERCYPDLASIPTEIPVDIVSVFRRPEHVPAIAKAAVTRGARALWLQLGVTSPEAERIAADAGLTVVADRCIKVEHAARF
jgi:predicted CoA-binding protein